MHKNSAFLALIKFCHEIEILLKQDIHIPI